MADDSTAVVSQPSAAGEEQQQSTVPGDYSAFLGPPSVEADLSEQERPAPAEGEEEPEQPGQTEGEPQEEPQAQPGEGEAEAETEQPPSIEERLQDLTQRELNDYAQRYPAAFKALQDPNTPEDLKHLLLDKIDSDHEIQRRMAEEQWYADQEGEPTPEAEVQQQPQPAAAQPQDFAAQRTAYYNTIDNLVKTQFDQQTVSEIGNTLLRMFNVRTEALNDPNVSPEDKQILQGLVTSVQREAPVLARYMADAVATVVPHVISPALESAMPGFGEMYERNMFGTAYESVRQQTDERGRPLYPGLPAFPLIRGTAEAQAFSQQLRAAAAEIPGFDSMVFRDQQGRVLPQQQQAQIKYTLLARHMSAGERMSPQVVEQAVETGRRLATRADSRRAVAGVTGAGRGVAGTPRGGANEDEDPLMAALDREIARQETSYQQPIRGRRGGR